MLFGPHAIYLQPKTTWRDLIALTRFQGYSVTLEKRIARERSPLPSSDHSSVRPPMVGETKASKSLSGSFSPPRKEPSSAFPSNATPMPQRWWSLGMKIAWGFRLGDVDDNGNSHKRLKGMYSMSFRVLIVTHYPPFLG